MAPSRAAISQATRLVLCRSAVRTPFAATRCLHSATAKPRPGVLARIPQPNKQPAGRRWYSEAGVGDVEAPDYLSEGELKVFNIIKNELQPTSLEVQDVSGGCGSMYALDIVSEKFKGLTVIKQHRLVNSVLGEEIKKWHGVQLKTRAP